jgi:hypothetical protein
MYNINIEKTSKKMIITLGGFMTEGDGMKYFDEYNSEIKKVRPMDYKLILDVKEMKAIEQKNLPKMKESFNFYGDAVFNRVYAIAPNSPTSSMQLRRVCRI